MSAILGWVREIVLVVLLGWVLEMLVPRSDFRRYVRLVIGLLVLVAVIRPALALLGAERPGAFRVGPDTAVAGLVARGMGMEKADEASSLALYARKVGDEAAAIAETVPGVHQASAQARVDSSPESPTYGEITAIHVAIVPGGGLEVGSDGSATPPKGLAGRVRTAVARGLEVAATAVGIQIQKGDGP